MLHVSDDCLPALSVPSVHMTAVRSRPIAVAEVSDLRRTCLERGEATLHETGLAIHDAILPLVPDRSVGDVFPRVWRKVDDSVFA